jgi:hypothetical protein
MAIQTTNNGKGNVQAVTLKGAINTPKNNAETTASQAIARLAKQAVIPEANMTPFGHKANCQGGLCDMAIIEGKCNTAFQLLDHVARQRQAPIVAALHAQYPDYATVISHLARRLKNHVAWCGNPLNMAHGGFISRLQKTGLAKKACDDNHKLIAAQFQVISDGLPLYTSVDKVRLAMANKAKQATK